MQLDAVLEGLRCRVSQAKRGLVLLAQWRSLLSLIRRHLVLDDTIAGTSESRETYSGGGDLHAMRSSVTKSTAEETATGVVRLNPTSTDLAARNMILGDWPPCTM